MKFALLATMAAAADVTLTTEQLDKVTAEFKTNGFTPTLCPSSDGSECTEADETCAVVTIGGNVSPA